MDKVKVAATQMACSNNTNANVANAEELICTAAEKGAKIILIQELFESQYFCMDQKRRAFRISKANGKSSHYSKNE